jgi:hypothetical protein
MDHYLSFKGVLKVILLRSRTGINKVAAVVIIIVIIVIAGAVAYIAINLQPTPPLQVSGVSLDPNSITLNSSATLTFTVKNNDEAKLHNLTVKFNVTSVNFQMSSSPLSYGNDGLQYWKITLQASQQSTYSFKVTGVLTGGAKSSTYSIRLDFYDENSTRFDTETQSLTVAS